MNIDALFEDAAYLEQQYTFYKNKKQVRQIRQNKQLVQAHITKAKHNLAFYHKNADDKTFLDWLIVILYYSLYHTALALITHKQYTSKNHHATILVLIKEYAISKQEAQLIEELAISKKDAQLYTQLKEDRHKASYNTTTTFQNTQIHTYHKQTIAFLNKAQEILHQEIH